MGTSLHSGPVDSPPPPRPPLPTAASSSHKSSLTAPVIPVLPTQKLLPALLRPDLPWELLPKKSNPQQPTPNQRHRITASRSARGEHGGRLGIKASPCCGREGKRCALSHGAKVCGTAVHLGAKGRWSPRPSSQNQRDPISGEIWGGSGRLGLRGLWEGLQGIPRLLSVPRCATQRIQMCDGPSRCVPPLHPDVHQGAWPHSAPLCLCCMQTCTNPCPHCSQVCSHSCAAAPSGCAAMHGAAPPSCAPTDVPAPSRCAPARILPPCPSARPPSLPAVPPPPRALQPQHRLHFSHPIRPGSLGRAAPCGTELLFLALPWAPGERPRSSLLPHLLTLWVLLTPNAARSRSPRGWESQRIKLILRGESRKRAAGRVGTGTMRAAFFS